VGFETIGGMKVLAVKGIEKLRRFPRIILPYGAGCLVSGKEEQKAHSNAM
jgi:hypothetical protein